MKRILQIVLACLVLSVPSLAQYVTVSSTSLTDVSNTPLSDATITFAPVMVNGNPLSFRKGSSGGQTIIRPITATVTGGAFTVSLVDSSITSPTNACYAVSIIDNVTGNSLLGPGYGCVQPSTTASSWCSGSACNFDAYKPNLAAQVQTENFGSPGAAGPTGPTGPAGPAGTAGTGLDIARSPLATILQCLHNAANQVCNIAIYGDSFGVVNQSNFGTGPVSASNMYSQQLRINLQAQYGSHGTGLVPLLPVLEAFNSVSEVNSDFYTIGGSWSVTNTIGPSQGATAGNGSLVSLANGAVIHFITNQAWDTLHIYCAETSTSGHLTATVDTVSVGSACTSNPGSTTAVKADMTAGVSSTSHDAALTCVSSGTACLIYGVEGTLGSTGISVHNFSVGSASATFFGAAVTTQLAFADLVGGGMQGVVTEQFTNEPAWDTTSQFTAAMEAIIDHSQAQNTNDPASVLVFLSPVDVVCAGGGCTPYTAPTLALATSRNVYIVNAQDRWGTTYNASSGLWSISPDLAPGIHPNDKGARDLYSQIWAAFVDPVPLDGKGVGSVSIALDTSGTSGAATLSGNSTIGYTLHIPNLSAACPSNFCFTLNPPFDTFVPGLAATQTFPVAIAETSQAGYSSTVTYTGTSLPSGFSGSASPGTITGGSGSATFTASFPYNQASGSSNFTISGTDGTNTHTQIETFTLGTENNNLAQGWIMNEGTGAAAVSTPTGDNLTLSNTTWGSTTGFPGLSLIFNGTTSVANAANDTNTNFDGSSAFSAACWVETTSITPNDQYLVTSLNQSSGAGAFWGVEVAGTVAGFSANGTVHVIMTDGTSTIGVATTGAVVSPGSTYLLGFNYSGGKSSSNITAYVNGSAATTSTIGTTFSGSLASGQPLTFGQLLLSIQPAGSFGGTIGACRTASRVLTSGEWSALYAAGPK